MDSIKNAKKQCHDCRKEIKIEDGKIKDGVQLAYEEKEERHIIFKCNKCFKENPSLTNFRKCEVYSRVVGYLRPVSQWNQGKKQEFKERKEYKITKVSS